MKTHDFNNSILVGKAGEQRIREWIEARPNVKRFEDVSDDKQYQGKDIDAILHMGGGSTRTIEIKTDTYRTGNIFYETESCIEYNTPGCMEKTQADYLYYYLTAYNKLYVINMDKYRKWFKLHQHMFTRKILGNKKSSGNTHSAGYCIPMSYLEEKFSEKYWKAFTVLSHATVA